MDSLRSNHEYVQLDLHQCLADNAFLYKTFLLNQKTFKYQLHFAKELAKRSRGRITEGAIRKRLKKQQEIERVLDLEQENKRLKESLHKERSCHIKYMQKVLNEVKELRIFTRERVKTAELTK